MSQKSYLGGLAEGFFFVVIVLGVIQTFAGVMAHERNALIVAGFAVDLVFCAEFLARAVMSGKRGDFFAYLIREGGFVDFVTSFPLIAFFSAPLVWTTLFPAKNGEIAAVLSSLGGLRVYREVTAGPVVRNLVFARILKFSRVLKFSGGNVRHSPMTPFFVARAFSLPVAAVVLVLIGFSFVDGGQGSWTAGAHVGMLAASVTLCVFLLAVTFFRSFFKKHVAAVLEPMLRGFKTAEDSTEVRIDGSKSSFETYQIADQYNRKWLPLKRKILEAKRGRETADG